MFLNENPVPYFACYNEKGHIKPPESRLIKAMHYKNQESDKLSKPSLLKDFAWAAGFAFIYAFVGIVIMINIGVYIPTSITDDFTHMLVNDIRTLILWGRYGIPAIIAYIPIIIRGNIRVGLILYLFCSISFVQYVVMVVIKQCRKTLP